MKQPWELPLDVLWPINKYGRDGLPERKWRKRRKYKARMVEYNGEIMTAARAGQLRRHERNKNG